MSKEGILKQIRALPYIVACRHTKITAPDTCNHDGAKCKCSLKIIRPHAPWLCPDFDEQNWKHFIAHPAVNSIIRKRHKEITAHGFVRTGDISARPKKIVLHYGDNLGGLYVAELKIHMPTLLVGIRYYIVIPGEKMKLEYDSNFMPLMHLRTNVRSKQAAMSAEIDALRTEVDTLRKKNARLKEMIEYQHDVSRGETLTGGPGYERTKANFEAAAN